MIAVLLIASSTLVSSMVIMYHSITTDADLVACCLLLCYRGFTVTKKIVRSRPPRVSFYVFHSHRITVQKQYSESGTGVGIFPTLANPILDRPERGKFLLWAVDFS
jgi:hypothetical protein